MSGFGRKGMAGAPQLTPGQAMALRAMPPAAAEPPEAAVSPRLAAFLAAERAANRQVEPGLSDVAIQTDLPSPPRPPSSSKVTFPTSDSKKSMLVAYICWWFCSPLAAHRFYLGAYRLAFAMAGLFWGGLMLGLVSSHQSTFVVGGLFMPPLWAAMILVFMVWAVVDVFLIPGLTRRANGTQPELAFT
jgi:TM2 domain-containing membrane protein YozV